MFNQAQYLRKIILLLSSIFLMCSPAQAAMQENLEMNCDGGILSVTANNVKSDALFIELASKCNTEIVTHGNVFPDTPVTITLKDITVADGIKRLVKACGLKNYLLNFKGAATEKTRPLKLDVFLGGTSEHKLGQPSGSGLTQPVLEENKKPAGSTVVNNTTEINPGQKPDAVPLPATEVFSKWDGSALIEFPEHTGTQLPYDQSKFQWNDDAKNYAKESMNILPPEIRDSFSSAYLRECDEIARQKNDWSITPETTSEALASLAKKAGMPPEVMKNLPKTIDDFNKPRMPLPE